MADTFTNDTPVTPDTSTPEQTETAPVAQDTAPTTDGAPEQIDTQVAVSAPETASAIQADEPVAVPDQFRPETQADSNSRPDPTRQVNAAKANAAQAKAPRPRGDVPARVFARGAPMPPMRAAHATKCAHAAQPP